MNGRTLRGMRERDAGAVSPQVAVGLNALYLAWQCVFRAWRPVISLQAGPAFRRMPGHLG